MSGCGDEKFVLVVDFDKVAVGCVLLQAAFGCSSHLLDRFGFESNTWLLSPTENMRRVAGTESQWRMFAELANAKWSKVSANRSRLESP